MQALSGGYTFVGPMAAAAWFQRATTCRIVGALGARAHLLCSVFGMLQGKAHQGSSHLVSSPTASSKRRQVLLPCILSD